MAHEFTPKQLNITPALGREKAEARLTVYGDRPENFAIKQAWYLVQHTDVTGRMNGEGALAYRRLSGYQLAKMVCEIANQNIMGADVTAYMYKFLGISLEVAAVEQFLVINNVFDTDIQEYEDELGVMDFLREVEIEGGNPADFLVQKLVGQNLDYSINGSTWIAEYAPIIVNGEVPTPEPVATPAPEAAQAEPVAGEQGSALADLQQSVSDYRDMLSRCDDIAECDRLLELIAECDKRIAKLTPAPIADSDLPFAEGMDDSIACAICHQTKGTVRTLDDGNGNPLFCACTDCMSENWTYDDLYHAFDSNTPDTMPTEAPIQGQNEAQGDTQLSSTMKAPKTPVMTKKERRRQKQAAIRQQYATRERKQRPVKPVISIAEVLRSMGIGQAA